MTPPPIQSRCPFRTLKASCTKEANSLPTRPADVCCPHCPGSPPTAHDHTACSSPVPSRGLGQKTRSES